MGLFDDLFESKDAKEFRSNLINVLEEFLDVFKDIRDTQKQRLDIEKQELAALQRIGERPPVKGIVRLGKPVEQ